MSGITGENHPSYGQSLSKQTRVKISEAMSGGNNPMYGRTGENHPMYGITGENHPSYGQSLSEQIRGKISEAMSGENHFNFGKSLSKETKALMSIAHTGENSSVNKRVFVYSNTTLTILFHKFVSCSEAAKYFFCSIMSISRYLKNGKLFQEQWILSLSKK
jgi:group I intron endonuclease